MYTEFFHFTDEPFKITPDPKFFFLSRQHEEALSALFYGIKNRKGFMAVIGEIGTGKTTICRALVNKLDRTIDTSVILNPMLSVQELLEAINDDFNNSAAVKDTIKRQIDALNDFLLRRLRFNKNAVVIIDEAQHLSIEALEMLRLLSNLETEDKKLLQIIFLGQKELEAKLKSPELRQLDQRIVIRYFLGPLNFSESCNYVVHRLSVVGGNGFVRLEEKSVKKIYEYSQGVPRKINIVCDRMLLEAYALKKRTITPKIVKTAINDVEGMGRKRFNLFKWITGG